MDQRKRYQGCGNRPLGSRRPPVYAAGMNDSATTWLATPLGQRIYALERKLVGEALGQVFGWQLLQIGAWGDDCGLMAQARTQRKGLLAAEPITATEGVLTLRSHTDALAISSDSVDAVLLPHTLEFDPDPHALLREVSRILPAEGQVILLGFRPLSLWGLRHLVARAGFPPGVERLIGERRLRDWLKLLGFEITDVRRYLFTGPWGGAHPRLQHLAETAGSHAWPLSAGAYLIKARKRVYALTPIRPRWRTRKAVVGGLLEPTTRVKGGDAAQSCEIQ